MKITVWLLSICLAITLVSCGFWGGVEGSGVVIKKQLEAKDFESIKLTSKAKVYVTLGDAEKLVVETDDNLLQYIEADVYGDELRLGCKEKIISGTMNFYVTAKELEFLEIDGPGAILADSLIKSEAIIAKVNGSGEIHLKNVAADEFGAQINGSGDVTVGGSARDVYIEINGSGDVDAFNLRAEEGTVGVNGSGDARVNVTDYLKAEIKGSGNVYYKKGVQRTLFMDEGSGEIREEF